MFEIGTTLRQARERQGLSIATAEEATKIRSAYLLALEQERFEGLPGPTYARGFLRSYGEYLGLDAQLLVDEYSSRFASPPWELDDELMFPRRRSARRSRRPSRASGIVVIALAGIVAVAVLIIIASTYPPARTTPLPGGAVGTSVITITEAAVNPVATAVTGATEPIVTTAAAPVILLIKPLAQVTVTVRALDAGEASPPLFQAEIQPDPARPEGIRIPRSNTGYLIRMDRPNTIMLQVNGNPVAPGATDTLLSIDPDGRVAAVR